MAETTIANIITEVDKFATEVGKEIKKTRGQIGELTNLNTTAKGDLVSAINEVKTALSQTGPAFGLQDAKDGLIKDNAKAADTTYSSDKIEEVISQKVTTATSALKSEILGGAEEAYDTLKEIETKLKGGDSAVNGILDGLGKRLRTDEAQTLSEQEQKNIAKSLGLEPQDFVATFKAQL